MWMNCNLISTNDLLFITQIKSIKVGFPKKIPKATSLIGWHGAHKRESTNEMASWFGITFEKLNDVLPNQRKAVKNCKSTLQKF
jgi:hypothetical protein